MPPQDTTYLPQHFDVKAKYVARGDHARCQLCEAQFTSNLRKIRVLKDQNPVRYCKRCARAVCNVCSENERQLSKSDTARYRVCDQCDYEMENVRLKRKLQEVKSTTEDRILELNMKQVEFTESNENLKRQLNDEQSELDKKLD